jgi:hypothetical protein
MVTVSNTSLATAFTWINNNAQSGRTYTIVAQASASMSPVTIEPITTGYEDFNIILSGGTTEKTISLSSNGSLFKVNRGTLTLENNITLQGRSTNNASLVTLAQYSGAHLVMNAGSKIQNNTATIDIVNNSAGNYAAPGGGVNVEYGTFTMNGGTISGNTVEATNPSSSSYSTSLDGALGGGVHIGSSGRFIMNNGTISGNKAYSAKFPSAGGGVYVGYGNGYWGTFIMNGGTISGNTVLSADNRLGGGVYIRNDKFTKTGGTIYGSNASPSTLQNTAKDTNSGHAVYALVGSTVLKRNTTAGTTIDMDSSRAGSAGGWE